MNELSFLFLNHAIVKFKLHFTVTSTFNPVFPLNLLFIIATSVFIYGYKNVFKLHYGKM